MSGIYWAERDVRLTNFSAVTKGQSSVVKIELTLGSPYDLADILRQCAMEQAAGKVKPRKAASQKPGGDV